MRRQLTAILHLCVVAYRCRVQFQASFAGQGEIRTFLLVTADLSGRNGHVLWENICGILLHHIIRYPRSPIFWAKSFVLDMSYSVQCRWPSPAWFSWCRCLLLRGASSQSSSTVVYRPKLLFGFRQVNPFFLHPLQVAARGNSRQRWVFENVLKGPLDLFRTWWRAWGSPAASSGDRCNAASLLAVRALTRLRTHATATADTSV